MSIGHLQPATPRGSYNDFRMICDCQVHARRENAIWRRSLRAAGRTAKSIRTRSIALLVGVPLALGALEFPGDAMNLSTLAADTLVAVRATTTSLTEPEAAQAVTLPIFNTDQMREQFFATDEQPQKFSVEIVKEHFFKTYVPYGSIIYREARRHNLPPELVAAVVEAESDFRPRLISHANAQGLMQIIPSTGRLMGAGDLFNPAQNIAAGTKYLRYLHNRFSDQRMVLAAYNAGEGNVEKFGGIPPFQETQNYLKRVNVRANHYRARINGSYVASLKMRNSLLAH